MVDSPLEFYFSCLQNLPNLITGLLSMKEVPRLDTLFFYIYNQILPFIKVLHSARKFLLIMLPVCDDIRQIT